MKKGKFSPFTVLILLVCFLKLSLQQQQQQQLRNLREGEDYGQHHIVTAAEREYHVNSSYDTNPFRFTLKPEYKDIQSNFVGITFWFSSKELDFRRVPMMVITKGNDKIEKNLSEWKLILEEAEVLPPGIVTQDFNQEGFVIDKQGTMRQYGYQFVQFPFEEGDYNIQLVNLSEFDEPEAKTNFAMNVRVGVSANQQCYAFCKQCNYDTFECDCENNGFGKYCQQSYRNIMPQSAYEFYREPQKWEIFKLDLKKGQRYHIMYEELALNSTIQLIYRYDYEQNPYQEPNKLYDMNTYEKENQIVHKQEIGGSSINKYIQHVSQEDKVASLMLCLFTPLHESSTKLERSKLTIRTITSQEDDFTINYIILGTLMSLLVCVCGWICCYYKNKKSSSEEYLEQYNRRQEEEQRRARQQEQQRIEQRNRQRPQKKIKKVYVAITQESIEKYIPKMLYSDISTKIPDFDQIFSTECLVCLCEFEPEEHVRVTVCMHMFHTECLDAWIKKHGVCPYCRTKVTTKAMSNHTKLREQFATNQYMRKIMGGNKDDNPFKNMKEFEFLFKDGVFLPDLEEKSHEDIENINKELGKKQQQITTGENLGTLGDDKLVTKTQEDLESARQMQIKNQMGDSKDIQLQSIQIGSSQIQENSSNKRRNSIHSEVSHQMEQHIGYEIDSNGSHMANPTNNLLRTGSSQKRKRQRQNQEGQFTLPNNIEAPSPALSDMNLINSPQHQPQIPSNNVIIEEKNEDNSRRASDIKNNVPQFGEKKSRFYSRQSEDEEEEKKEGYDIVVEKSKKKKMQYGDSPDDIQENASPQNYMECSRTPQAPPAVFKTPMEQIQSYDKARQEQIIQLDSLRKKVMKQRNSKVNSPVQVQNKLEIQTGKSKFGENQELQQQQQEERKVDNDENEEDDEHNVRSDAQLSPKVE